MKLNRNIFPALLLGTTLMLGACTKGPMDTPLLMGKGHEAYKLDLSTKSEKMTQQEREAFDWAVDGVTYDQLITQAPNKTPREVIRMGVTNAKALVAENMESAERAVTEFEDIRSELQKIKASGVAFRLEKTFFGHMPHVTFDVTNASRYDIGDLYWVASIKVNGAEKAEAAKALLTNYKNSNALAMKSGGSYDERHRIGHVAGDFEWTTQTILQAKTVEVFVVPDVESIQDLQGNRILPKSPYPYLEQLKIAANAVERYGSI